MARFSGETASGWQQVNLPSPVAINANTTYVVSYHTPIRASTRSTTIISLALTLPDRW
jgi:Domain of unknown function (DUF4082)